MLKYCVNNCYSDFCYHDLLTCFDNVALRDLVPFDESTDSVVDRSCKLFGYYIVSVVLLSRYS